MNAHAPTSMRPVTATSHPSKPPARDRVPRWFLLLSVVSTFACSTESGPVDRTDSPGWCAFECDAATDCETLAPGTTWSCYRGLCVGQGQTCEVQGCPTGEVCRPVETHPDDWPFDDYQCVPGCDVPADCASDQPLLDEAHWECRDGACFWLGCADDAECNVGSPHPEVEYSCLTTPDLPELSNYCVIHCSADSECSAYDSNEGHFGYCDTTSGFCARANCKEDANCTGSSTCYVLD